MSKVKEAQKAIKLMKKLPAYRQAYKTLDEYLENLTEAEYYFWQVDGIMEFVDYYIGKQAKEKGYQFVVVNTKSGWYARLRLKIAVRCFWATLKAETRKKMKGCAK